MTHAVLSALEGFQLALVVAVLFAVGFLVSRLIGPFWFTDARRLAPAHLVAVGQLTLVLGAYLRSFSNYLFGSVEPITALDVVVLLLALGVAVHLRQGLRHAGRMLREAHVELTHFALVVAALLVIVAWNELPRVTMLSTDPDQHAFFAHQVQRFGMLPYFHQFWWGDVDFRYPGGFAILNYVWMAISGLDARQVVQVQTLLQVQLAILLLFESVQLDGTQRAGRVLLALLLYLVAYYGPLTYGYQRIYFHNGGAPRASSMLVAALSLDLLLFALSRRRDDPARRDLPIAPQALFLGLSITVSTWINVVNLPYLLAMSGFGLGALLVARPSWRRAAAGLLVLAPLPLVLIDPYYLKRLVFGTTGHVVAAQVEPPPPLAALPGLWGESLASWLGRPLQFLGDSFYTNLASVRTTAVIFAILALGLAFVIRGPRRRSATALLAALALVVATRALVFPLAEALLPFGPDFNLLSPYIDASRQQFIILIWYAALALIFLELTRELTPGPLAGAVSVLALLLALAPNSKIKWRQRYDYAESKETVTPADFRVIEQIEKLFRSWRLEHPELDSASVPRILIPNAIIHVNGENWLFPYGAARILPLYDVFPTAFFYFQGSNDYTFEAYQEHVCTRFDTDWLHARGIRYLFVPANRGPICVAELDGLLASAPTLIRDGDAVFVEIPASRPGVR